MGALYFFTSVISAFLVFVIQPLSAKSALPLLGGSPSIWNATMLFFQTLLLLAYFYAHITTQWMGVKRQSMLHMGLMVAVLLLLPLHFQPTEMFDPVSQPVLWLLAMLSISVGLPYFITSTSAPLLQKWLSNTDSRHAANPYFLYVGSNIGSLAGLLCYPLLIEPSLALPEQLNAYSVGYAILFVLFACVAYRLNRYHASPKEELVKKDDPPPSWKRIFIWVLYAFIPSSLLYGVTTHITTDVASVPLLWVIPLALYLLTFILLFGSKPVGDRFCRALHLPLTSIVVLTLLIGVLSLYTWLLVFHLLVFFICAMTFHSLLVEAKPSPRYLTSFYLWMSLGGTLGGIFNTIIAPNAFATVLEYPLILFLSIFVRIRWKSYVQLINNNPIKLEYCFRIIIPNVAIFGFLLYFAKDIAGKSEYSEQIEIAIYLFIALMAIVAFLGKAMQAREIFLPAFLGLALVYMGFESLSDSVNKQQLLFEDRNFFGVSLVQYLEKYNMNQYTHGTTNHGIQSLDEQKKLVPVSYYAALREVFEILPQEISTKPLAVMGLGAGTVACYGKKDQEVDFFEIDPMVVDIAHNPKFFTYLRDCPPKVNIVMGDARLSFAKESSQKYGLLVIDVFNSDAIPVHLMTLEAIQMYFDKLAPHGLIAFHISNRHLDLRPVLATVANRLGLVTITKFFPGDPKNLIYSAEWVILGRNQEDIKFLMEMKEPWKALMPAEEKYLWTDNYSNIVSVLKIFRRRDEPQPHRTAE